MLRATNRRQHINCLLPLHRSVVSLLRSLISRRLINWPAHLVVLDCPRETRGWPSKAALLFDRKHTRISITANLATPRQQQVCLRLLTSVASVLAALVVL
jgi:hypothetical protein